MVLVLAASSLVAQSTVAQRLGYPANAKLLILHADDLGVAHSVNAASLDALDQVIVAGPEIPREHWKEFYLNAIANLKPGLTEIIVHLGHDDAELQAVTVNHEPYGSAWRQRDYDVVTSAEFKKALRDNGVILVRYRDILKLAQQP